MRKALLLLVCLPRARSLSAGLNGPARSRHSTSPSMAIDILDVAEVDLPALPNGKRLTLSQLRADGSRAADGAQATERWSERGWSREDAAIWHSLQSYCDGETLPNAEAGEAEVSARVWPAAAVLCGWLLGEDLRGCSVLELGAGTGACGLYAAALGAARVLLTDASDEESMRRLRANVEANAELWGASAQVAVAPLVWGSDDLDNVAAELPKSFGWAQSVQESFDWVILSDCTYGDASSPDALALTLSQLLRRGRGSSSGRIRERRRGRSRGSSIGSSRGSNTESNTESERGGRPARVILAHEHRSGHRALRDEALTWSPTEGDTEFQAFAEAAAVYHLALRPIVSRRPTAVKKGAFTCWSADVTILEVLRESDL